MQTRHLAARAGVLAVAVALLAQVPAGAGSAVHQRGKVTWIVDGDTIRVDLDGGGEVEVRLMGIDTPETGTCGSGGAKKALSWLLNGRRVDLYADDSDTTDKLGRLPRRVTVVRDGKTIDAVRWMLKRGWGPWKPRDTETSHAVEYHTLAEESAAAGLRYFDTDRCDAGPVQSAVLRMDVQWQADAVGSDDPNDEFVRVTNLGSRGVDVDRWNVRMGPMRDVWVPSGKPIAPGATLTLHVGKGTNSRYHRYLGFGKMVLTNANLDGGPHLGHGVYILDRDGDLRSFQTWPCVGTCADPTGGNLQILDVQYDPDGYDGDNVNGEWMKITNLGSTTIETGRLVFENFPFVYELPPGHTLGPGEILQIRGGKGTDSRLERFLDGNVPVMSNDGDRVLVRTFDGIIVDCFAWGSGDCPA